jgi:hypothetical protein
MRQPDAEWTGGYTSEGGPISLEAGIEVPDQAANPRLRGTLPVGKPGCRERSAADQYSAGGVVLYAVR